MDPIVEAELSIIEHVTGERPRTCPWWGFREPDVAEVLRAYDFFESGQLSEYWGADPEWWIVQAVQHFHRQLLRCRADVRKVESQRKRSRGGQLPSNYQIIDEIRG